MCWSAWGVDVCATFAPEYKDTVRDTKLALRSAALFSMVVYILLPIGLRRRRRRRSSSRATTTPAAMDNDRRHRRGCTDFFVVCLVASFIITMNTATADGGRALYGISRDGMTVKQLGTLNRYNVPGNAMTVDMVVNILFVLFIGNIFGILAASNLGLRAGAHVRPLGLRAAAQDRPNWPRPIKLGAIWTPIAGHPRRLVPDPDDRRLRLVPDRGRRATAARRRRSSASASS